MNKSIAKGGKVKSLQRFVLESGSKLVSYTEEYDSKRRREEAIAQGVWDFYLMRRKWSNVLIIALFLIIIFNIALVGFVGSGTLKFVDEWFLRLVLTANVADIIGLMVVVVKFLFQHRGDEMPASSSAIPA